MLLPSESLSQRRLIYALLITLAAGSVAGRILSVVRLYEPPLYRNEPQPAVLASAVVLGATPEGIASWSASLAILAADIKEQRGLWSRTRPVPMPTHGDNDRSRWGTVRALVDDHTYAIGHRDIDPTTGAYRDSGIITQDGWKTIDKVLRPQTHDFYSSKPPLLSTLAAGEYWLLKQLFGWSITEQRWQVVRVILLTVNWLPLVVYLLLLSRLLEQFGTTDWGRLYVLAAACFGTLLTPFIITFNNHTLAACSALFAPYPALQICYCRQPNAGWFVWAGLFAGFTACNELPAVAFAAMLFLVLFARFPKHTILLYLPALALLAGAFFLTNYLALGKWEPAYANFGSDWYEFEGSYWKEPDPNTPKFGIDWAYLKESRATYGFHVLFGHHGLFSLTPIWLLALAGMAYGVWHWRLALVGLRNPDSSDATGSLRTRQPLHLGDETPLSPVLRGEGLGVRGVSLGQSSPLTPTLSPEYRGEGETKSVALIAQPAIIQRPSLTIVAIMTLILTAILAGYYIFVVNDRNRNYGGWTIGPRWLMWLTPFLLLTMLPIADWLSGRRWGRCLAYVLLAISVFSASYSDWNPWKHPWLYDLLQARGWINY